MTRSFGYFVFSNNVKKVARVIKICFLMNHSQNDQKFRFDAGWLVPRMCEIIHFSFYPDGTLEVIR